MREDVFLESVIAKCDALRQSGMWLTEQRLRVRAWLSNFDAVEQPIAAAVLNQFIYIDGHHTDQLLKTAADSLGQTFTSAGKTISAAESAFHNFIDTAVFTRVEGEDPNPSDSGNLMCRKARQVLGIREEQILEPVQALHAAKHGTPVVFLDDFVGTGQQMLKTWRRPYPPDLSTTFEIAASRHHFRAVYLCAVATQKGLDFLQQQAQNLEVFAACALTDQHSIRSIQSSPALLEVDDLPGRIDALLKKYAPRLTVPSYVDSAYGYSGLGLTLAFEHSVPDATLPILWAPGDRKWSIFMERK